jgi:hypothetical protein
MTLGKAIEHGKEHRKPYRGSKRFDRSCRNHQGCPYCEGNRKHSSKVKEDAANEQIKSLEE